jgi:hypothetical protein
VSVETRLCVKLLILTSSVTFWFTKIKEDEVYGVLSTYGKSYMIMYKILLGRSEGKSLLVELDVDGRILLK